MSSKPAIEPGHDFSFCSFNIVYAQFHNQNKSIIYLNPLNSETFIRIAHIISDASDGMELDQEISKNQMKVTLIMAWL